MMKNLFSFLLVFSFVLNSVSAQTSLTTAVDFTITDRFGEEHNLFEILESGKYVLIDFFAHYCSPCCDVSPDINKLYYNYGCNDVELFVISIEGAGDLAQLESFELACGGTSDKPVVTGLEGNGIEVAAEYDLGFYPTIIIIAPDKSIVETDLWPFNFQIAKDRLQTFGISPTECRASSAVDPVLGISTITLTPNPASTRTLIEFSINEGSLCNIQLLNLTGQTIQTIENSNLAAGQNIIPFNTENLAAGTYLVKVQTEKSAPQISKLVIAH